MKPKVTFIIDNLILAGTEIHLYHLACGLKDLGYRDLEVVSLSGEGEIQEWMARRDIPVRNFRMKSIRQPVFLWDFFRLAFYLARRQPEVVHTYLDTANVFGVAAAKLAGIRRIMTSRRDLGVFRSRRIEQLIGQLSNGVEKVVCVCEAAGRESVKRERLHGRNLVVIHNGIEVERFAPASHGPDRPMVYCNVAVANRKEKGHEELVRAFALVAARDPQARLRLVGDGPLLPMLKQLAGELGIAGRVEFMGQCFDIPRALDGASVFVLPSHSEGISNALLEAMALGIPAVATDVGGNPDVVSHGETGLLVQPRSHEALAEGMLAMAADRDRLARMGTAAAETVRSRFLFEQMIANFDNLYRAGSGRQA